MVRLSLSKWPTFRGSTVLCCTFRALMEAIYFFQKDCLQSGFQRRNRTLLRGKSQKIHLEESRACDAACFFRYEWILTPWSSCRPQGDSTCGEGIRKRGLRCIRLNDARAVSHHFCNHDQRPQELETWCPIDCPVDCEVTEWSPWDTSWCSSCGDLSPEPRMIRQRVVTTPASPSGRPCPAVMRQSKPCTAHPCYSLKFSEASCDLQGAACGIGQTLSKLSCVRELDSLNDDPPEEGMEKCGHLNPFMASEACFKPCPSDCLVSEWSPWSTCKGPCVGSRTGKVSLSRSNKKDNLDFWGSFDLNRA